MLMVMFNGSEKLFTGRTSLSGNKLRSSACIRALGVGLVQFNAATKPEFMRGKVENKIYEVAHVHRSSIADLYLSAVHIREPNMAVGTTIIWSHNNSPAHQLLV